MSEHQRRSLVRELRDEVARCADRDQLLVRARQWLYKNKLVIVHERAIRTLIAAARAAKLKQAPPSPPALIQQHLIAGEPQFQSCAQMDKPSRVGYGLHRRNTQPAKSARYWSASTCFTRWTFISTWQTSPISSCAATRADLSPGRPQPEPRSRASAHRGGRMLSSVLPVHHHRPVDPYGAAPDRRSVASGCRRCPRYRQLGRNVQNAARRTCCLERARVQCQMLSCVPVLKP